MARISSIGHSRGQQPFRRCALDTLFHLDTALFAEMLSLPNDGRYPALDLAPQQRRQRTMEATMEAIIAQIEALTRQNPVLMIFRRCALDRPDEHSTGEGPMWPLKRP
jgi:hypothetical protein